MGLLSWVAIGLVIGIVARWLMPGPEPGGFIVTILLGLLGAIVAGIIGANVLGFRGIADFDIRSSLIAIGGSVLVLLCYRMMVNYARA